MLFARVAEHVDLPLVADVDVVMVEDPVVAGLARSRVGDDRVFVVLPSVDAAVFNPVDWQRDPAGGVGLFVSYPRASGDRHSWEFREECLRSAGNGRNPGHVGPLGFASAGLHGALDEVDSPGAVVDVRVVVTGASGRPGPFPDRLADGVVDVRERLDERLGMAGGEPRILLRRLAEVVVSPAVDPIRLIELNLLEK